MINTKPKHTPTPWHRHQAEPDSIAGPDGKPIALVNTFEKRPEAEDIGNLDYILKTANSHAKLVSALKRAEWIIKQVVGNHTDPDSYEVDWDAIDGPELKDIRAALKGTE